MSWDEPKSSNVLNLSLCIKLSSYVQHVSEIAALTLDPLDIAIHKFAVKPAELAFNSPKQGLIALLKNLPEA